MENEGAPMHSVQGFSLSERDIVEAWLAFNYLRNHNSIAVAPSNRSFQRASEDGGWTLSVWDSHKSYCERMSSDPLDFLLGLQFGADTFVDGHDIMVPDFVKEARKVRSESGIGKDVFDEADVLRGMLLFRKGQQSRSG